MRLRARIFLLSFTVSVVLVGGAIAAVSVASGKGDEASLSTVEKALGDLSAIAKTAAAGGAVDAGGMIAALGPLKRDAARRAVLERDAAIGTAAGLALFLVAEAIAALAVSAAAAASLTARWSALRDGILRLRRSGKSEPFFTGVRDEFGAVEEELDGLVAALSDREHIKSELRALQGWGDAAAFLAHQSRTPLASLSLSARTAMTALSLPGPVALAEARSALERTEAEATRIASIFSRVRSLSGFKDPELVDIDPEEALREAAAALGTRGLVSSPVDAVSVERSGVGPRPPFDKAYLVEAFYNLLSNSIEACAERGIAFNARVILRSAALDYSIEYIDSITGLEPGIAGRVGAARYTTKANGTGLGVWLVGRIAALHGGSLDIGMTDPGGLRFTMTFPSGGIA